MTNIVQTGNRVLRRTAQEVALAEITAQKTQNILKKMKDVLFLAKDGVALAAPQIGISLRIFIVLKKYTVPPEKHLSDEPENTTPPTENEKEAVVFINPKIIKISKKKKFMQEGCLSVTGIFGTINRSEKLTVEAYDEKGRRFNRGASDLLAQIFQHEMDHLDGVLFTDTATNLEKIEIKK